ncbi:MAG: LuxR family transcriptional regulator [Gammaproteobacteria bacterium]|nr:MAG: LuxR family transcriptional regulator [Gammaproteobacteria bacterium]
MIRQQEEDVLSDDQWDRLQRRLRLPQRQYQVIRLLFKGYRDKEIAYSLNIAHPTVRSHLRRLYTKFSVQDRTELVLHIMRDFIIQPQSRYLDDR